MPNATSLCTACGLCCAGVLFDNAPLTESEAEAAQSPPSPLHRLSVFQPTRAVQPAAARASLDRGTPPGGTGAAEALTRHSPRFPLPCAALEGTRCSVYADRPEVCREFTCKLLSRFNAGEVELSRALALVHEVQSLARSLRRQLALPASKSVDAALHAHATATPIRDVEALLTIGGLRRLVTKHFHDAREVETSGEEPRT